MKSIQPMNDSSFARSSPCLRARHFASAVPDDDGHDRRGGRRHEDGGRGARGRRRGHKAACEVSGQAPGDADHSRVEYVEYDRSRLRHAEPDGLRPLTPDDHDPPPFGLRTRRSVDAPRARHARREHLPSSPRPSTARARSSAGTSTATRPGRFPSTRPRMREKAPSIHGGDGHAPVSPVEASRSRRRRTDATAQS